MLKYQIALINVWWSEDGIDTRYHNSVTEQRDYFSAKTSGLYSPLVNFIQNNAIETTVPYRDTSGRSPGELLKCNYAVIQQLDDTGVVMDERYYFAYPVQDSGTQMIVRLSLDDIQTNYFSQKSNIAPCNIRRAHLDRWGDVSGGVVSFNTSVDSPLYTDENMQAPKYLKQRINCEFNESNQADVQQWLNNNVLCWAYLFISPNNLTGVTGVNQIAYEFSEEISNRYLAPYAVLCAPVMRSGDIMVPSNNTSISWQLSTLTTFATLNGSYVIDLKYSNKAPTFFDLDAGDYTITEGGTLVINANMVGNLRFIDFNNDTLISPLGNVISVDIYEPFTNNFDSGLSYQFNVTDIVGVNRNPLLNPKLLITNARELRVTCNGEQFTYDPLKLGTNDLTVRYYEMLQPGITRYYATIEAGLYGDTGASYIGLVSSSDNSIVYSIEAWQSFISQNKNFFTQRGVQIGMDFFQNRNILSSVNAIGDTYFTVDNLKNAPQSVQNANGDALLNIGINGLNVNLEIWEALGRDMGVIDDYTYKNGYAFNRVDSISNYDNIRYYFNYIEADVESITGNISNIEKERLRERLTAVRFWNTDTLQYNLENYERRLANGTL